MNVSPAIENYLETILIISKKQNDVHASDICSYLNYSRPTVSIILKQMKENGLVTVDDENHITLTDDGLNIAEAIYERHNVIAGLLMAIGVNTDTAFEDACKVEHQISEESFSCIKKYYKKLYSKKL